jgi:thiol-disulfide isomerase/thioredoxin
LKQPIVGAELVSTDGAGTRVSAKSDAQGICRINETFGDAYTLTSDSPGFRPLHIFREGGEGPVEISARLEFPIHGAVTDSTDRAVGDALVCQAIVFEAKSKARFIPPRGWNAKIVTDESGRFSFSPPQFYSSRNLNKAGEYEPYRQPLCFVDEPLRRMALVSYDSQTSSDAMKVILKPVRKVRFLVERAKGAAPPSASTFSSLSPSDHPRGLQMHLGCPLQKIPGAPADSLDRRFEADLPEGKYRLVLNSSDNDAPEQGDLEFFEGDLVVPPGDGPVDLPPVQLPPSPYRKMMGRTAAEIDAVDIHGKPVKLAGFRGKIVILDFWGTWCGPCLAELPELVALKEQLKDQPLVILALHDGTVQSSQQFEEKFALSRARILKGRDLPFPVLFDQRFATADEDPLQRDPTDPGSGKTISTYGVSNFPSTFVIAQDGTLVGKYSVEQLDAVVQGLLKK